MTWTNLSIGSKDKIDTVSRKNACSIVSDVFLTKHHSRLNFSTENITRLCVTRGQSGKFQKKWIFLFGKFLLVGLGFLDFDAYQRICVHFIKDPEALLRAKDKDFKFGHLITHDEEKKH